MVCYLVTNYSMILSFSKSFRAQKVSIIHASIFNQDLNFIFRGKKVYMEELQRDSSSSTVPVPFSMH